MNERKRILEVLFSLSFFFLFFFFLPNFLGNDELKIDFSSLRFLQSFTELKERKTRKNRGREREMKKEREEAE